MSVDDDRDDEMHDPTGGGRGGHRDIASDNASDADDIDGIDAADAVIAPSTVGVPTIQRDVANYQGKGPDRGTHSDLWQLPARVDGGEGAALARIIDETNAAYAAHPLLRQWRLDLAPATVLPEQLLVIDASHDRLPTAPELARVIEHTLAKSSTTAALAQQVRVIDTATDLDAAVAQHPSETLIMSCCVDKTVYNVERARALEAAGNVCVPGPVTAPGGIFSDKLATYRLLDQLPENAALWHRQTSTGERPLIAPYRSIAVEGLDPAGTAAAILNSAVALAEALDCSDLFVKPHEGGGGLGGFRLSLVDPPAKARGDRTETTDQDYGFLLPDLSKLTGNDAERLHPAYIDFDPDSEPLLDQLAWIFRLFETDPGMKTAYLRRTLDDLRAEYGVTTDRAALAEHLRATARRRKRALAAHILTRTEARDRLAAAIGAFEAAVGVQYEPLVCQHIDFGAWGLRVHMRLGATGPVLESVYYRIFQLVLGPDGIGYIGADNISNKLTGALETLRCGAVQPLMIAAIGGPFALRQCFDNALCAFLALAEQLPAAQRRRVPLRAQFDLSPVTGSIVEGNADTARGPALGTQWPQFVDHCAAWLEDSLRYYSYRKQD